MVSYDEEKKNACLSLRQAEILEALAKDEKLRKAGGGVPEIQDGEIVLVFSWWFRGGELQLTGFGGIGRKMMSRCLRSTQSLEGSCWRPRPARRFRSRGRIY